MKLGAGSGTLLSSQWVLTAAHVVDRAASPEDITIRRGNAGDPNAEVRHASRVAIHHAYVPPPPNGDVFSIDVALLELDAPFSTSFTNNFSQLPTSAIVDTTQTPVVSCYGYGRTGCTEPYGTLNVGVITPGPSIHQYRPT